MARPRQRCRRAATNATSRSPSDCCRRGASARSRATCAMWRPARCSPVPACSRPSAPRPRRRPVRPPTRRASTRCPPSSSPAGPSSSRPRARRASTSSPITAPPITQPSTSVELAVNKTTVHDFHLLKRRFARVTGVVRDRATGQPIPNARGGVKGFTVPVEVDASGRYLTGDLGLPYPNAPSSATIHFEADGYWPRERSAAIQADRTSDLDFDLVPICTDATVEGKGLQRRDRRRPDRHADPGSPGVLEPPSRAGGVHPGGWHLRARAPPGRHEQHAHPGRDRRECTGVPPEEAARHALLQRQAEHQRDRAGASS